MKIFKSRKNGTGKAHLNKPYSVEVTDSAAFKPIAFKLYTVADPRLPQTFACCNQAYTLCVPFERLGFTFEVVPLELRFTCFCVKCEFSWIYLMFKCPECGAALIKEELPEDGEGEWRKFFLRGVPTIEIDGQRWIEGSRFSQAQIANAVSVLFNKKKQRSREIRKRRRNLYNNANYVEVIMPGDQVPAPYNRHLIRKSDLKVKNSILNLKNLRLSDPGMRVMPGEDTIHRALGIQVVKAEALGWQLKGLIVPKESYFDLANIGKEEKTARQASTAYVKRTPRGEPQPSKGE